jgi:hypothetical protein
MVVMATEQERQLRRQAYGQGAAQGAVRGASIGTMILPGIGTAIGAVAGSQMGGLRNVFQTRNTRSELAELNRRQEMGALGLTDEERAALEQQYMDPQRALMREQIAQGAPQVDDAAIAARMLLGREEQQQQSKRAATQQITAEDIKEKRREEERIQELASAMQKNQEQFNEDLMTLGTQVATASLESQETQARLADYGAYKDLYPDATNAESASALFTSLFG